MRRSDSLQLIKLVSGREPNDGRAGLRLPVTPNLVEGYDLSILTEVEVRQQPLLNNVKVLWRYARVPVEAAQYQQKSRLLSLLPEVNLEGGYVRIDGQIFVFFIMVVAAAEVSVGLAIIVMMYRNTHSTDVNFLNRLKH